MTADRLLGVIVSWNDDRGFGFVRPADGPPDAFVHIRAFRAGVERPHTGDSVSFCLGAGRDGRMQALDVHHSEIRRLPTHRRGSSIVSAVSGFIVLALFVGGFAYSNAVQPLHVAVLGVYVAMSFVTFAAYGLDKFRARSGGWRVSESRLLVMGFVGGWPGAIIAQQLFRHKTRKASFQRAFWVSVALNLLIFAIIATPSVREFIGRS